MSNELQRLTNYSGAGNQNVSMHFLQKEELDWFLARTADTFCQQQLFRRYKGEMYMLQQMVYRPLDEATFYNNVSSMKK